MKEAVHIDLHMHSTASDGSYTPSEVARACLLYTSGIGKGIV